jgi:sodium/potassium-transporting ATPase subunit alpha
MTRDGNRVELLATEIVPGDILFIKSGNKLPADVRFFEVSSDAKFDRSILTGESAPVPGAISFTDQNYLETNNIGMAGTHCISGSAKVFVCRPGTKPSLAKLLDSPMRQKLE